MTESQCLIVCWYFLPIPVYDGPVSELQIISTSRHLLCRSAANQRASSACCKSFPCSASPPSWRNTRCPTNTAGRGGCALQSLHNFKSTFVFQSFIYYKTRHSQPVKHTRKVSQTVLYISLSNLFLHLPVFFSSNIKNINHLFGFSLCGPG